ncbi:polysaccharide deacetylase family protein [Flavobacterium sp. RHBU_3]|uniref:polysaccharide deacetylase family protein n=1 Tax=Flavobacterium sp. RHBU_3 TaxID=3391184 RepID=UPI0039854E52
MKALRILLLLFPFLALAQNTVSNYKTFFGSGIYKGETVIITRSFTYNNTPSFLYTDLKTLNTGIISAKEIKITPTPLTQLKAQFIDTPYTKALATAENQSFSLQDAGLIHGYPKEHGITLTIDLCPSHKKLDRVIFTTLIEEFSKTLQPVPIALSITGRFMLTHTDDILWLKDLEKQGKIKITWINHTYNHHYDPKAPLTENFILKPGTDISFEILGIEIALLQHGLTPSVFFRFPGLVSDNKAVTTVTDFGLIPIGSDAWLAKGQQATNGTIVLIHGNGNEPVGVKDFITLLHTEKEKAMANQWLLYDLRETVEDEFKE